MADPLLPHGEGALAPIRGRPNTRVPLALALVVSLAAVMFGYDVGYTSPIDVTTGTFMDAQCHRHLQGAVRQSEW